MEQAPKTIRGIDLTKQVTFPVARLNAKLTAQATRLLRESSDLSLSQWRLMAVIDSRGPISMAEFSRFTDFDKGQTSRVVADLVRRGLLRSQASEANKRVQILSFSEAGRAAYEKAAVPMKARREHLFRCLTAQEHAQLHRLINKLAEASDQFEVLR
jgi:DNA-binding MarR family transcriptional regulator